MTLSTLDDRIRRLFSEALAIDVQSAHADLIDTGLLDSLVLVELLVHLEEAFGIDVMASDFDLEDFRTVSSIGRFITRIRAADEPEIA
jgi:methoxymalonate biosynthesis acyl carrier protein